MVQKRREKCNCVYTGIHSLEEKERKKLSD